MNLYKAFFFLICLIFLACCGNVNKQEAIAQKWKIYQVELIENDSISQQFSEKNMGISTLYEFKKEGTYTIQHSNQADWGKWEISTDEKILALKSEQHPQDNEEFRIIELTFQSMVLMAENKGKKERIRFIPAH